jgi:hypothetical protein
MGDANLKAKRPYVLDNVDPGTDVEADTDVLAEPVAPAQDGSSVFISVCVTGGTPVMYKVYADGSEERVVECNDGDALTEDAGAIFADYEMKDEPFNIRFDATCTIVKLLIVAKAD